MSLHIKSIINKPVDSNCYIISQDGDKNCIVIDPGEKDGEQVFTYLNVHGFTPEFIILTHEHFDHIWGVNTLKKSYPLKLICSRYCSKKIITLKGNLSVFYDQVGFFTFPADIKVEEINGELRWNNYFVKFIPTPGHTGGCVCIDIENNLFTGDFLIKDVKTRTNLPGGNKNALADSFERILNTYPGNTMVYPGHGMIFRLTEVNKKMIMG